jgi:hypothetical protein
MSRSLLGHVDCYFPLFPGKICRMHFYNLINLIDLCGFYLGSVLFYIL